ncbi:MAG: isoprenylcysteine carboxylmethyltransferase family protein [Vicinamibacterales bacterium]
MSALRPVVLLLVVLAVMGVEARRAARNERRQRRRGGIEPPGDVYAVMRVAYPLAFVTMCAEGWWRARAGGDPPGGVVLLGLLTFLAAKSLKWWAIATLGDCWTFRVIVVPGGSRIAHGPYRWLAHPNYVGVMGELVGVAMLVNAWLTGPIAAAGFLILIVRRIQIERRALRRLVLRDQQV